MPCSRHARAGVRGDLTAGGDLARASRPLYNGFARRSFSERDSADRGPGREASETTPDAFGEAGTQAPPLGVRHRAHGARVLALPLCGRGRARGRCDPRGVRNRADPGRRFAQPVVPLQHARIQAIRGRDEALPFERVRCPRRHRRPDPAAARLAQQATRSRHRPATDRRHARNHLAVFGAPAARRRSSSCTAFPRGPARPAQPTTRSSKR